MVFFLSCFDEVVRHKIYHHQYWWYYCEVESPFEKYEVCKSLIFEIITNGFLQNNITGIIKIEIVIGKKYYARFYSKIFHIKVTKLISFIDFSHINSTMSRLLPTDFGCAKCLFFHLKYFLLYHETIWWQLEKDCDQMDIIKDV